MSASLAEAQTGRVAGTVRDEQGRPVKGATIVAEGPRGTAYSTSAASDDRGRFNFVGLETVVWTFRATAAGYTQAERQMAVTAGRSNRALEFVLLRRPGSPPASGSMLDFRQFQGELDAAAALLDAGQRDAAIRAYQSILERAPALTQVHLQLGTAFRAQRDHARALAEFGEALKADPGNERARLGLGLTYLDQGDLAAAENALEPAGAAGVPSRDVLYALGDVKRAQNQGGDAAGWYRKSAVADPNWPMPLLRLAELAAARGDRGEATTLLEKAIAMAPDAPTATEARLLLAALKKQGGAEAPPRAM